MMILAKYYTFELFKIMICQKTSALFQFPCLPCFASLGSCSSLGDPESGGKWRDIFYIILYIKSPARFGGGRILLTPKALDNTAQGSKSPLEHAQSRSWFAQWPLELGPESQLARNGFDVFFTEFAIPLCPVKHSIFVETTSHYLMKHKGCP
jgi:hypothetical protein